MSMGCSLAVVGSTGLVGRTMLRVLEERDFPCDSLRLFASAKSAGIDQSFRGTPVRVEELTKRSFDDVDIALFSAGSAASVAFAPYARTANCVVIDNSSAWRMHPEVPLVVPEVNAAALLGHHGIIANPNCSTIELVVVLKPLHEAFGLRRVVVSTYQSVSGAGQKGLHQLDEEVHGRVPATRISTHPVAYNLVFHAIDETDGPSEEERKMRHETRKILDMPGLPLSVTCVRAPVLGGHGESVNVECTSACEPAAIRSVLNDAPGITVFDDPLRAVYPTPLAVADLDDVFVGRIRADRSVEHGANLWLVADNLRKGAATNAVQIAEELLQRQCLSFDSTFPLSPA
ncbi:MAG: aspartate-semialdehyde dehydrogenase [Candidatus Kapaibacterium sp.]